MRLSVNDPSIASNGAIQTYSGKLISIFDPDPSNIIITDIAHSLSNLCRFGGHTRKFYSVAEHSIHCSRTCDSALALCALLHDASEAYMVDIPRPIKIQPEFSIYRQLEENLSRAIADRFNFDFDLFEIIKPVDSFMCYVEAYNLMPQDGEFQWPDCPDKELQLNYWSPSVAKLEFLRRYAELTGDASVF